MNVIGVIPARWGSTRFPGKSLALLRGKPLVCRVLANASRARLLSHVLVATDDERIRKAVEAEGGEAVMTRPDHPSGTDRVAEAVSGMDADVVVNVQGDEPQVDPRLLDRLAQVLVNDARWDMSTAATPMRAAEDVANPNVVKVVCDAEGRALYFSRAAIPFVRDSGADLPSELHRRHVGVYAYRRAFLAKMVAEPPCDAEKAEKLEQLRALHIGGRIAVVDTDDQGIGVDTPADLQYVEAHFEE